ncbi:MAG: thioredoxin domain-containing protein [Candidatus Binatia bacterium]
MIRLLLFICAAFIPTTRAADDRISWQAWSEQLFAQAKRENRFVLLDLEAVWCHWCHVMDEKTYHDPQVVKLVGERYLPVRVDQDAQPDISIRYEDYGWPATIVFAPDGSEIVKRRGYIAPAAMASMLSAIIEDPSPGPSVSAQAEITPAADAHLSPQQRVQIEKVYRDAYDKEFGGWGRVQKFIHAASMEYALAHATKAEYQDKARQTLDAALNLIDPVWGGVYQYSDRRDWKSPHFEKIMSFQADYLRLYTQAYARWEEPRYLKAARDIDRYLEGFLTAPSGAFYTSQDADLNKTIDGHVYYANPDSQRRALGLPRIDQHLYARENGWSIRALAELYEVTGDPAVLNRAQRAAAWIVGNRALPGGGFRHDETNRAGPYLGDTLAMAEAFLALYTATGERGWLTRARDAVAFIANTFKDAAGFSTALAPATAAGVFAKPVKQIDENIALARLTNLLNRYTGDASYRTLADHALRYLTVPAITDQPRLLAGLLLADQEFNDAPAHLTVVGPKRDAAAQALFAAATRYSAPYRRIEWWDKGEGPLPNPDVQYPSFKRAAAFVCVNNSCSSPIFQPTQIAEIANRLLSRAN